MRLYFYRNNSEKGFTLVESLVSIAIFVILIAIVYQTGLTIVRGITTFREKTSISGLADQYMEIARNLPYSKVGTMSGNPHGDLYDLPNATTTMVNGVNYQIYYVVNYIDDPADGTVLALTDPAPNDYKQVKLYIKNSITGVTFSFLTSIVPKGLEGLTNGGAFYIKVFDSVGQPVPNASINITNNTVIPSINLTRTSDAQGNWVEVGLPNSDNSYRIAVSKSGYSLDQTYPVSASNPNPIKPDSTISNGQITGISFAVDRTSSLDINTVNQTCSPVSGVSLRVKGSKLIGTPSLLKFDGAFVSDNNGKITLQNIEWDNYIPVLATTSSYMVYGSSPIQQINISPGTEQSFTLIVGPKTTNSLLVIVKDASTGNPIEGANVNLTNIVDETEIHKVTGGSSWSSQSWVGGTGQVNFVDTTKYYEDDGNVSVDDVLGGVKLKSFEDIVVQDSGFLVSSTFDTGSATTKYTTLDWQPPSQDPATTLKFQIATNNDGLTWDYRGPDGATTTYYTVPGSNIDTVHDNDRYIRYKAFLSTSDNSKSPVLTSINVNYVAGCFTPGQAMFSGLSSLQDYRLSVDSSGYQSNTISGIHVGGYNILEVSLSAI